MPSRREWRLHDDALLFPESSEMPAQTLKTLIQKVASGATLGPDEIRTALELMTEGVATPAQMGAFLMALTVRGETVEEITGAARSTRELADFLQRNPSAIVRGRPVSQDER